MAVTRRSKRSSTVASTTSSQAAATSRRTRSLSRNEGSEDDALNDSEEVHETSVTESTDESVAVESVVAESVGEPIESIDKSIAAKSVDEPIESIADKSIAAESVDEPIESIANTSIAAESVRAESVGSECLVEPDESIAAESIDEPIESIANKSIAAESVVAESIDEPIECIDNKATAAESVVAESVDETIESVADKSIAAESVLVDDTDDNADKASEEIKFFNHNFIEENIDDEQIPTASKSRKKKKKKRKKKARNQQKIPDQDLSEDLQEDNVEIEYVSEKIELPKWDPNYATFSKVFEAFQIEENLIKEEKPEIKVESTAALTKEPVDPLLNDEGDDDNDDEEAEKENGDEKRLSKKQLKKLSRMEIAQLKQTVSRPDVVEMHDANSKDPHLLVYLKAYKNTVPVPRHWCFKRKYLAGKRGFVKPPFELPEFIKQTGIMEMRAAMQEKEDTKSLKSKQRGKVRPKLGKIDIDYQKLHDAFFKYQTKPKMTIHGDLYYEGKEFEIRLKEKKPGDLSDDLRTALGMPVGPGKQLIPPPWLIAMQRYGPPPSYPNLKIPGLNAAIPDGAAFGYHAGGWGKPPVDEMGKPLYGDVFGTQLEDMTITEDDDQMGKASWGELESESESEEESEEEDDEEDQTGLVTPGDAGLITPSGLSSVATAGMETPDMIELRKRKEIEDAMDTGGDTPALFTVLPEKRTSVGAAMMGSAHTYDIGGTRKGEGVEITLDPSELELEPAAMAAKYDDTMKEREAASTREDFSDMVAEHAAKKKRKKPMDSGKAAKKYKEFKF